MDTIVQEVGVREAKNNFSALTARVNATGIPLTVVKNGKPWVVISPADSDALERRNRADKLRELTALIESQPLGDQVWDEGLSDRDLLDAERMKRFG